MLTLEGKSTFVKIIAGVENCTVGFIQINGQDFVNHTTKEAIDAGIQVIFQDLSLFNEMSVADNIAMNRLVKEGKPLTNKNKIRKIAEEALKLIKVNIPLDIQLKELSIANKQLIAICRALTLEPKLLFMDEPTTALTKNEVDNLLEIILKLKQRNIAIVFISHKLDEIMRIADSITVIRDGCKIGDFSANEIDIKKISFYMTGKEISYRKYIRNCKDHQKILEIKKLCKKDNYNDVSLSIRKGDVLGITGLLGSGRTELALSIFGMNKPDSGEIFIGGEKVDIHSPRDAINLGISLVPEDRTTQGLFLKKSIAENIAVIVLKKFMRFLGNIDMNKSKSLAKEAIGKFKIKVYDENAIVNTLSGGNQQKSLIARWSVCKPEIFILDTPTVGIDIGSKAEIYKYIQQFASNGMGVIIISDEVDEIVSNCNRVMVMFNGNIVKEYSETEMLEQDIKQKINELVESGRTTSGGN